MLLRNVFVIGEENPKDILVEEEIIKSVSQSDTTFNSTNEKYSINFTDAITFPGLINSHEHLDFNLFPSLKNNLYNNYREWGKDIHKNNKDEIEKTMKVPQHLRTKWGIYKNLLNGFTTVINHGEQLKVKDEIINIFQNTYSLHSVGFEKRWKWKLINPLKKKWPIAMHVGEGKDDASHKEIDQLIQWNFLQKKIIGIHGVAMDAEQAAHFRALVWCPASNYFLLNRTASIDFLKDKTDIIFGSDSTLTSSWNIWEHIRLARNKKMLTDKELFESLTKKPSTVWGLNDIGEIKTKMQADIVVAKKKKNKPDYDAFFSINPEDILMIMHKGNIRLFDDGLKDQINEPGFIKTNFSKIEISGSIKYVQGNLSALIKEIKEYYPETNLSVSAL